MTILKPVFPSNLRLTLLRKEFRRTWFLKDEHRIA